MTAAPAPCWRPLSHSIHVAALSAYAECGIPYLGRLGSVAITLCHKVDEAALSQYLPPSVWLWQLDCTRLLLQQFPDFLRALQPAVVRQVQQFFPDIPFVTEYLLADRWYKGLDDQPTDESGRIVPYKNNCLANHR